MSVAVEARTAERMDSFKQLLADLERDGYGELAPPFNLPVQNLAACRSLEEEWEVADEWLHWVRHVGVPTDMLRNQPLPLIGDLKSRVEAWRRQEHV